jgi:UDP-N-acetylglucosamine 2-epimerase (non-hydrolysing)
MKVAITVGTRPEIIKMAPVVRACIARATPYLLLHTGQHYSYEMDGVFFEELGLPLPHANLSVGSLSAPAQIAAIVAGAEPIFAAERPDVVLVEGDTNSVLACALAAQKMGIAVGHVEAGLRSYDRGMPEEINRILTDHLSEYLFAPTEHSRGILRVLGLHAQAAMTLTDSGGLQEEACTLRVPCVTLRDNTERPESVEVGANVLVGAEAQAIADGAARMAARARDWPNPFGDGKSGEHIVDFLLARS